MEYIISNYNLQFKYNNIEFLYEFMLPSVSFSYN